MRQCQWQITTAGLRCHGDVITDWQHISWGAGIRRSSFTAQAHVGEKIDIVCAKDFNNGSKYITNCVSFVKLSTIWQTYDKNQRGCLFLEHPIYIVNNETTTVCTVRLLKLVLSSVRRKKKVTVKVNATYTFFLWTISSPLPRSLHHHHHHHHHHHASISIISRDWNSSQLLRSLNCSTQPKESAISAELPWAVLQLTVIEL